MLIRDRILADLKEAMSAGDSGRVATLRLIQAAIKDRDIAARAEDRCDGCCPDEVQGLLQKLLKQREESAAAYEQSGRLDLAEQERAEAELVRGYLPKPMDKDEIADAVDVVVAELDASGLKDVGRCMGTLKERYAGRMDFSRAGQEIKARLG